jgi:hypothetical protein
MVEIHCWYMYGTSVDVHSQCTWLMVEAYGTWLVHDGLVSSLLMHSVVVVHD